MRAALLLPALLGSCLAAPRPQDIDIDAVEAAPDPVFVTPAVAVASQTLSVAAESAVAKSAAADISTDPAVPAATGLAKRLEPVTLLKPVTLLEGDCSKQTKGSGQVPSDPSPGGYLAYEPFKHLSSNAPTPDNYVRNFQGKTGSLSGSTLMSVSTLTSYDTHRCASLCDGASGCVAFNIYIERDPSLSPNAEKCPNPPPTTNYKCALYGAPIDGTGVSDAERRRLNSFEVVITASSGYNKNSPPGSISGFTGPQSCGGAINAPLDANGQNTYMGVKYYPFCQDQGYTPSTCASACTAQTAYNKAHPKADGSYNTCRFFNAYVLSKNNVPQGLYCSLYSQVWAPSYATNNGQYRGSDRYTVSRSYTYSLYTDADYVSMAAAVVTSSSLQPFCSSLLGYTTPITTVPATTTTTVVASTETTTTTTTEVKTINGPAKLRRELSPATPTALTTFAASIVSSACSLVASPVTSTSTVSSTTTATELATTTTTTTSVISSTTVLALACPTGNLIKDSDFTQSDSFSPWTSSRIGVGILSLYQAERQYQIDLSAGITQGFLQTMTGLCVRSTYQVSFSLLSLKQNPQCKFNVFVNSGGIILELKPVGVSGTSVPGYSSTLTDFTATFTALDASSVIVLDGTCGGSGSAAVMVETFRFGNVKVALKQPSTTPVAVAPACVPATGNLIQNAGFESSQLGAWQLQTSGQVLNPQISLVAHKGTRAYSFSVGGGGRIELSQTLTGLCPGSPYRIGIAVRAVGRDPAAQRCSLTVSSDHQPEGQLIIARALPSVLNTYASFSGTYTAAATSEVLMIKGTCEGYSPRFEIDDVVFALVEPGRGLLP